MEKINGINIEEGNKALSEFIGTSVTNFHTDMPALHSVFDKVRKHPRVNNLDVTLNQGSDSGIIMVNCTGKMDNDVYCGETFGDSNRIKTYEHCLWNVMVRTVTTIK